MNEYEAKVQIKLLEKKILKLMSQILSYRNKIQNIKSNINIL